MKSQILRTIGIAVITGLLIAIVGVAHSKQSSGQGNGNESADQSVQLGQAVTFSANQVAGASYQWIHNGVAIDGQTDSTLTIAEAQISDAGLYSCNIATGADVVSTETASLMVYTFSPDFDIVVYATPIVSSGSSGSCPGAYTGYVTYTLAPPTWGWAPNPNLTVYTASDTTRSNTKVEYVGDYGDSGCHKVTVTVPYPAVSPAYRFTIYFTNNVPSTNYPITLSGFN